MHTPIFPNNILDAGKTYLQILDRWNNVHSLTAIRPDARFEALLQDSAALIPHLDAAPQGSLVADFGSGMGMPAIIIALHRPDLRVAAIDRNRKKTAFVRQAALELKLGNVSAICGSIESMPPLAAQFGVAKAVGPLAKLLCWWERHAELGAPFFAFKGPSWDAMDVPCEWEHEVYPYQLPVLGERMIVKLWKKTERN